MTPRSLQHVLRFLADIGPPVSDAELLRRFIHQDESAFAEIVRRHGRLVWAVCRHLTRCETDADDAFQATFLVLLKNAKKIREAAKLSAWLHSVAYKVCAKARLTAQRRTIREQAMSVREGNGCAVPDSAWDRRSRPFTKRWRNCPRISASRSYFVAWKGPASPKLPNSSAGSSARCRVV